MEEPHLTRRRFAEACVAGLAGLALGGPAHVRAQERSAEHRVTQRRAAADAGGSRPLLARFGRLRLPWVDLGGLPTAVRALDADTWVQEDGEAGAVFGGSKARKLEPLLGDALSRNASEVVTSGAPASNHLLATAVHAQRLGLRCTLLVLPGLGGDEGAWRLAAAEGLGARIVRASRADVDDEGRARARHGISADAIFLPLGGSSPSGNAGYVNAGLELGERVARAELPEPRRVILAAGTGGAAAGLAVGLAAAGLASEVVAVRTAGAARRDGILGAAREVVAWLRARDPSFPSVTPRLAFEGGFLGPGYQRPSPAGERALRDARAEFGLRLDATYTAKAFAALRARRDGGPVLFVHTFDARIVSEDPPRASVR